MGEGMWEMKGEVAQAKVDSYDVRQLGEGLVRQVLV